MSMVKHIIDRLETEGYITLSNELFKQSVVYYRIKLVNKENFPDMTEKLETQLREEGLYNNSYVSFLTSNKDGLASIYDLPIYGEKDKYVTKWLHETKEKALKKDLTNKTMNLKNRIKE